MKVAIIYASTTGNTQAMAEAIAAGAQAKGAEVVVSEADSFDTATLGDYDSIAFGSPAMGAEELEDSVESLFTSIEGDLSGKTVSLFGSYDWGDGQWMRDWAQRAQDDGAQLFSEEGLICNETPDDDVQAACRKLGADLAAW